MTGKGMAAVVAAGDRGAAMAIGGESKVFLEVDDRPLVVHTVLALQAVPELSEVWVVGDSQRLAAAFARPEVERALVKPLHLVEQLRNLYENLWEGYRRVLPGAGAEGRDPEEADADVEVLYLSGDLPFATPQEVSQFIRRARELDCDYAAGLVTEESITGFLPAEPGGPGIRLATYNLREGRFRQSNLHLVRPGRMGNRRRIQEMYERRHQKELGPVLSLAWRLLRESGGLRFLWYFGLMHLASLADRHALPGLANVVRRWIPLARIERGCGDLLGTRFRFVVTDIGGCAVDIDLDEHLEAARARFVEWQREQHERAEQLAGALPLPAGSRSGDGGEAT